jgi:hypothetical protein
MVNGAFGAVLRSGIAGPYRNSVTFEEPSGYLMPSPLNSCFGVCLAGTGQEDIGED